MNDNFSRRAFIKSTAASGVGTSIISRGGLAALFGAGAAPRVLAAEAAKPVLLGGKPVHTGGWQKWPVWRAEWEPAILSVMRSGKWFRGSGQQVGEFEKGYASLIGAKRCLATASGTTALMVSLHVVDVDAGDEVIVSPYTFIASYNAILAHNALPVFADTDPATLTMDPKSIASRITDRTRAIMPVHIFGLPCDMDAIMPLARQRGLKIVEDACQAWLAEYKGRKCGTMGDLGCFSFQESKHIPSGEGGAITSNSDDLIDRCDSYHNCGRTAGTYKGTGMFTRGCNYRMQQFQAALLLAQFDKLQKETAKRRESADFLSAKLGQVAGITPVRLPANSRPAWHLYAFRYDAKAFSGLTRDGFIRALTAEGVPCSSVYREQYNDGLLDEAIASRGFKRLFSAQRLKAYRDSFKELKGNQETCANTVAFTQNMLLSDRAGLEHIVEAVAKIQKHSGALAQSVAKA